MMNYTVVFLASGFGSRYGTKNKLMDDFQGKPLYLHGIYEISQIKIQRMVVVTQYSCIIEDIRKRKLPVEIVHNIHPERGISESLKLGLSCAKDSDGCCFMVCDQPLYRAGSFQKMIELFEKEPDSIVVSATEKRTGNPVMFPKDLFSELQELTGDTGGRQVIRRYPERVRKVFIDDNELFDIDTVRDKILLENLSLDEVSK